MITAFLDTVRQKDRRGSRKIVVDPLWQGVWGDSPSARMQEIDPEHDRLRALVNVLNLALIDRKCKADILEVLNDILTNAVRHFQHEEQLFAQHGYFNARQHSKLHSDIIASLGDVTEEFEHDDLSAEWIESASLIKHTLVSHLLEEDMQYRE